MCGTAIVAGDQACRSCGEEFSISAHDPASAVGQAGEDFAKAKRRRLIWMASLSVVSGVVQQLLVDGEMGRPLQLVSALATTVLIASWCHVDARQRDFTIGRGMFLTIVFLTFLGVPIYLLRTRGVRGIVSILLAVLFVVLMVVLEEAAILVTYWLM